MAHASDRMVSLTDFADFQISVKIFVFDLCHGRPLPNKVEIWQVTGRMGSSDVPIVDDIRP
jgi:hypothetical protein